MQKFFVRPVRRGDPFKTFGIYVNAAAGRAKKLDFLQKKKWNFLPGFPKPESRLGTETAIPIEI